MNISLVFTLNGVEHTIGPTIINSLLITLFLCIACIVVGNKVKKADYKAKPQGIVHIAEIFVEKVQGLTNSTMGEANWRFAPYMATLALYLIFANLIGLIGLQPPTSDYNVPFTLALVTFVLIHFNSIKYNGIKGYVKGYFEPMAFLFPINLLGEIATPISMSFRLLGNILSGTIIMSLIYSAFGGLANIIAPFITPAFHAYFDVFSGVLQTFIFVMLSMVNIKNAIGDRPVIKETK